MPSDSISTFLDATQGRRGELEQSDPSMDISNRAGVLARISDGPSSVAQLTNSMDLSEKGLRDAVNWLSQNGLIEVHSESGGRELTLALTSDARKALDEP